MRCTLLAIVFGTLAVAGMTTAARCGAGSFLRSMRFGVIGNEARVTIARGIMYSGTRVRRCASASKRSLRCAAAAVASGQLGPGHR